MKSGPIVSQIQLLIQKFTPLLTDPVPVTLSWAGAVVTATSTTPHNLRVNDQVVITGVREDVAIASLTRVATPGDTQAVLVTSQDHDFTHNLNRGNPGNLEKNPVTGNPAITISGATEADWNGTFDVDLDVAPLHIPNRRTINLRVPEFVAQPTSVTGTPVLHGGLPTAESLNRQATVIAKTNLTFDFTMPVVQAGQPQPAGSIVVHVRPRVAAAISVERAASMYSERAGIWAFVVLGDNVQSKGRETDTDAIDEQLRGSWRQRLVQPVSVFVFIPSADDLSVAQARDTAEDLRSPIQRCLLGGSFESGLTLDQNPGPAGKGILQYEGDAIEASVTTDAVLVYEFAFQATQDITDSDLVSLEDSVAWRDVDLTGFTVLDTDTPSVFDDEQEPKAELEDFSMDDDPLPPP